MAIAAVGLKTHIWNNHLKSMLFLLLYPLVISTTFVAALKIAFLTLGLVWPGLRALNEAMHFRAIALHCWYLPYLLLGAYLLIVYLHQRNRVDVTADLHAVTRGNAPHVHDFLEHLCIARGLAVPYFFVQEHGSANAYTAGLTPETYRIVLTSGLLDRLNPEEVECVLAHELTHLINGDTRLIFLLNAVSHVFRTLSNMVWPERMERTIGEIHSPQEADLFVLRMALSGTLGLVFKLANIGTLFAQLFISRKREYIADAGAVELTKNPEALLSALRKIGENAFGFDHEEAVKASLFHYMNCEEQSTHPTIADRVAAVALYNRVELNPPRRPFGRTALRHARLAQAEETW